MGDFNHYGICWRDNTAVHQESKKFLECVDNFFFQVVQEPMRKGAMEGLVSNVNLQGSLGCSDHKMVEFKILRVSERVCSKLASL